jgi:hypothetical protein
MIRQHDDKKNEWELKNMLSDLKKKKNVYFENSRKEKHTRSSLARRDRKLH